MSVEDLSSEGKSKQETSLCRRRAFIAAASAFITPSVMKAAEDVESLWAQERTKRRLAVQIPVGEGVQPRPCLK